MDLAFKELEELVAAHYGVREDGAVALRSRLKHLQRAKFPAEVNTGKGRRAVYGWAQIIELFAGLELIDVGCTPEVASSLVSRHRQDILVAAATFANDVDLDLLAKWVSEQSCPLQDVRILAVTAGALRGLSGCDESQLGILTVDELVKQLTGDLAYNGAFCFIELSRRLLTIMNYLSARASVNLGAQKADEFVIGSFRAWSEDVLKEILACL